MLAGLLFDENASRIINKFCQSTAQGKEKNVHKIATIFDAAHAHNK